MTTVVTLKEIQLRDAKAALSAVVDDALRGAPYVITRHGRREVVLIAYEEWEKTLTSAIVRPLIDVGVRLTKAIFPSAIVDQLDASACERLPG